MASHAWKDWKSVAEYSRGEFTPFEIKKDFIRIQGGYLKEPVFIETEKVKRGPFEVTMIEISFQSRDVARAIGLDCRERSPFHDTTLLNHLGKLRNQKVDRLIHEWYIRNDPAADEDADAHVNQADAKRIENYHKASIPKVIDVKVEAFKTPSGEDVAEKTITIASTDKKHKGLNIAVNDTILTWMSKAIHCEWDIEGSPWTSASPGTKHDVASLPQLSQPDICYYAKTGRGGTAIKLYYCDVNGKWKPHQKSLGNIEKMNSDLLREHVLAAEVECIEFYNDHHVPQKATPPLHDSTEVRTDCAEPVASDEMQVDS